MDDSTAEGIYLGRSHKEVVRQPQHPSHDCLFLFLSISILLLFFYMFLSPVVCVCVCASLDFSCCLIWNSCRRPRRLDRRIGKGKRGRGVLLLLLLLFLPYLGCQKEAGNDVYGRHSYSSLLTPSKVMLLLADDQENCPGTAP